MAILTQAGRRQLQQNQIDGKKERNQLGKN